MKPKGKLIIIGGAVDKGSFTESDFESQVENNLNFFEKGILKRIINESIKGTDSRIEIIPTASKIPEIVGPEYAKAFSFLGAQNVEVMNIQKREDAISDEYLNRIIAADVVFFTGGDQLRLTSIIGGTPIHDKIIEKYQQEDFIYVGTSAGAHSASKSMIYQGSSQEALLKGEIKITSGLGLIDHVVIDTHFVKRGRIGRLFQAIVSNPKALGIGLGEDTGLLVTEGDHMEALGTGLVILVDGRKITDTNITDVNIGEAISIKNLVVHVMNKGDVYLLSNHEMTIHSSN
ncbi:MAG: cyanophycinase [Crocinitomicaceae bacterium]|jgi:cyanophycinase|nr:cyanophycinase [Crocinitomicaceae bacterium]MCF8410650.1 cyanophycinase [Crocinitomicaceae bacterium]